MIRNKKLSVFILISLLALFAPSQEGGVSSPVKQIYTQGDDSVRDNSSVTVICPKNFVFDSRSANCICPAPFGLLKNLCQPCPANAYLVNGQCLCSNGFNLNLNTLLCVPSQLPIPSSAPVLNCPPNSTPLSSGVCQCNSGYFVQGNLCVLKSFSHIPSPPPSPLPSPSPSPPPSSHPTVDCQQNMYWNGVNCQCLSGFYLDGISNSNQCILCKDETLVVSGSTCICGPAFYPYNQYCLPCKPNSFYNTGTQSCQCNKGYTTTLTQNYCVPITSLPTVSICPLNSILLSTGGCQCNSGYTLKDNICVFQGKCLGNLVWNGTGCSCPAGTYLNVIANNNQCIKCDTTDRVIVGGMCLCSLTAYQSGKNCVPCKPNSSFNPLSKTCECNENAMLQGDVCVLRGSCPGNQIWNGVYCQCRLNTYIDVVANTNQCIPCTNLVGRVISNTTCICAPTFYPSDQTCLPCQANSFYNSATKSCQCNEGYEPQGIQCVRVFKCLENQISTPSGCQCPADLYLDVIAGNNRCILCNTVDRALLGSNCICAYTYYPFGGACFPCRANSFYNAVTKMCQCFSNYLQQGGQCVGIVICLGNQIKVSDICQCPVGTFLDVIANSNLCITCKAPSRLQSATNCTCANLYYPSAIGICITCTPNSAYNPSTKTCECIIGFQPAGLLCTRICPKNQIDTGTACGCPPIQKFLDLVANDGSCVKCDDANTRQVSGNNCICKSTLIQSGATCIPCPGEQIKVGSVCQCPAARFLDVIANNNQCIACIIPQRQKSGRNCICGLNYHPIGGACTLCWPYSVYSPTAQNCLCNQGFATQLNNCLCRTIEKKRIVGNKCVCRANHYLDVIGLGSNCVLCTGNPEYVISGNNCTCATGHREIDNRCVPN